MSAERRFHALLDRLSLIPLTAHQSELDFTLADARDMAACGEWVVGLENLCDNLYEFSFPLTSQLLGEIVSLAYECGIDRRRIEPLKELIAQRRL